MGDRDVIEDAWRELRMTSLNGDSAAIAGAVQAGVTHGLLQAAVSAALVALRADASADIGVTELVARLRGRDGPGDEVAAETLLAAQSGSPTDRVPARADLEMLGEVLGQQLGGYLELATGEVWPTSVIEEGGLEDVDPEELESERWLYVPGDGREAWRDMASFANHVDDDRVREILQAAIEGRGAFRRFKTALDRHESYWIDWRVWSSERQLGRAREWLAFQGYEPIP